MAYEIIRHTEFPGKDDGAGYALDLLQEGGTPITLPDDEATGELQLAAEPLVATYQMGDLPWGPRILNVELHLLNEDTLLQAIRSGDEEEYRLRLTKGTWDGGQDWGSRVTSGTVQWVCKIRPKKTQRIIQDRVATQIIQADDSLEQLQWYAFLDGSGAVFTGRNEIGDIIHTILNKLGLSLGFKHITNWYAKTGNNDSDVDGISDVDYGARIDQEHLYKRVREHSGGIRLFGKFQKQIRNLLRLVEGSREPEDDPPSCWDVLQLILEEWQLVLYQAADGWIIEQIAERDNTLAPKVWKYDSAGSLAMGYPTTETLGLVYDESGEYHQIGEAKEWQYPAYTYARVRYQHDAISEDLIPSSGFRDWDSATGYPRGWLRNSTSVAIDPEQRQIQLGAPAMMYDNDLEEQLQWSDIVGDADYMYCQTPQVTIASGDVMTFEFDALYTFAHPFADLYQFVAYAQVLEVNSGMYLSGTNDTSGAAVAVGNWSTDADNRIDLFRVARATSGNTSPLLSATIETNTTLGLPTGDCEFKIFLYKGTDFGFRVPFAPSVYYLDRLIWGPPAIIYQPQDSAEDEETIRQSNVANAQSGIEALPDRIFFFGSGPTASSASRLTYDSTDEYPTEGKLALNSGDGTAIEHSSLWLTEFLKLRRLGALVYTRTMRVTDNVCYEGQHHLREGSNYYYAHRLRRLYRGGIVHADWVEIRQDSATVDIEDVVRDWPKKKRPDDTPATGYEFVHPFEGGDCLNAAPSEALFPMIEAAGAPMILLNDNQNLSTTPNGVLQGSVANWTWGVNGLSKTASGGSEWIDIANDIFGSTTISRLTVFNQLRRDTSSEISVWRVTAGVQTVIECKILTTGVVRLAVTDETGATTNVDSTVTIGADEWAGVGHSIVPSTFYTTVYAYVLNKDNAEPIRIAAIIGENVSLDFTDIKMFYSNELTIRVSHWLAQAWTKSMFLAEALCARDFTVDEGVDPGEVTNPQPAMIFRTDAGIEIYDLGGTQAYDWADATNVPGGITCRPAWHPGHSKVFYGAGEDIVSADVDGSNIVVESVGPAGEHCRVIQYSPANNTLYVATSDGAGTNIFGTLTGSPGSMTLNQLGTQDMADFFADAAHNVLIYEDLSDDDLYALILNTFVELDTAAEANSAGVWYVRSEQGAYRMDTGGDVYRQLVANVPLFATTKLQVAEGSGFTSPRPNTLMIEESLGLLFLVANDHVLVAPAPIGIENPALLTSADFADIATLGSTCRGASLAMINISPSLAAPVLSLDSVTATTVTLSWPDIAGETSYVLQRSGTSATGPWVTQPAIAADTITTTRTGETPETPSWWQIRGNNAAGAGPWSNVVAATTTAQTTRMFTAIQGPSASYNRIYELDIDAGTVVQSWDFGAGTLLPNVAIGSKLVAYHPTHNIIIYGAWNAGTNTASIRQIDLSDDSDTLAYTLTTKASCPVMSIWVQSDGSVYVGQRNTTSDDGYFLFASADINVGTTWDAPTVADSLTDTYHWSEVIGGTQHRAFINPTGIFIVPGVTFISGASDAAFTCWWDVANSLMYFWTDAASRPVKRISDAGGTATTLWNAGDNPRSNLFLYDGKLWHVTAGSNPAPYTIKTRLADGTDEQTFYTHADGGIINGIDIVTV